MLKKLSLAIIAISSVVYTAGASSLYEGSELQNVFQDIGSFANDVNSLINGFTNDVLIPIQNTLDSVNDASYQIGDISNTIYTIENNFDAVYDSAKGEGVLPSGEFKLDPAEDFGQIGNSTHIREFIHKVLNFLLQFLGLLALVMVIYAGFRYLTSLGDDGSAENARKTIQHVVIGIIIILASFALVWTVITFVVNPEGLVESRDGGEEGTSNIESLSSTTTGSADTSQDYNQYDSQTSSSLSEDIAYDNAIYVSGNGVSDQGSAAYIPTETAQNGVNFGLRYNALAQFQFSDGTTQVLDTRSNLSQTISKTLSNGRHFVYVTAEDLTGQKKTLQKELLVGGMEVDYTIEDRLIIEQIPAGFTAHASSIAGNIVKYYWSCSGGSGCFSDQTGSDPKLVFSQAGIYKVSLTATDSLSNSQTASKEIQVVQKQPIADFTITSNQNIANPKEFQFDASQSTNIYGENSTLNYYWDLGESQRLNTNPILIYKYSNPNTYQIKLIVTQEIEGQTIGSQVVEKSLTVLP